MDWLLEPSQWQGIKNIVRIKATVIKGDKQTIEERFYITSLENMNIIRKIALNKFKSDKSDKDSIKGKKKGCGWDDDYAAKILWQMMA